MCETGIKFFEQYFFKRMKKIINNKWGWVPVLLVLLLINWMASSYHSRIDFTAQQRFTLSAATSKMLQDITQPVTIDVMLNGSLPSGFKKLRSSTLDALKNFKDISGTSIKYNFVAPTDVIPGTNSTYADTSAAYNLYPINLTSQVEEGQQQQYVYPFALVRSGEKTVPVSLYSGKTPLINFQELNSSEALLEYNLANAISKVMRLENPVIGYAIGNGEPENITTYDLVQNVLSPNYKLFTFNPETQPKVPLEFAALMIVKPTRGFSEMAKLKLDQYVMQGGKLLISVDQLNAELDSLQKGEVIAYDRNLNLGDLFFKYGCRVNPDLVMDLQCDFLPFDVNGDGQFQLLPWNYFPVMESPSNHPINKNLGFVVGKFVNSIDTVEVPGIKKTVLLQSSANARTIATPALISGKENETAPQSEKYKRAYIPTAILLEGKFSSVYANRLPSAMRDTLAAYNAPYLPEATTEGKVIIAADGDLFLNNVVKGSQPIPMGMNPYTYGTQREFPFANKEFLVSALDYLTDLQDLSEAKGKDYILRLLDGERVKEEKLSWQFINIVAPLVLLLLGGLLYNFLRKKRYAS